MGAVKDLYANAKVLSALAPIDFVTDVEGPLIDVSAYKGIAQGVVRILEDDSQGGTEKLTATVHKVDSDSDTLDSDNLIASFDVITDSNDTGIVVQKEVLINLDLVDTQYIQFKFVETNTYEGLVDAFIVIGGVSQLPIN